jgi:hypothetical protein
MGFRPCCTEALQNVQAVQIVRTSSAIKIPKQPTNVRRSELTGWSAKIDILKIFSVFKTGVSFGQHQLLGTRAPNKGLNSGRTFGDCKAVDLLDMKRFIWLREFCRG